MARKQKTYLKAAIVMAAAGGTETQRDVTIGIIDRIKADRADAEQAKLALRDKSEEWWARAAYHADVRAGGTADSFDAWVESLLGLEIDDDDSEDPQGEAQTPA